MKPPRERPLHASDGRRACGRGPPLDILVIDTVIAPASETPLAKLAYRTVTVLLAVLAILGQASYLDALYWNVLRLGRHMVAGGTQPALLSSVITGAVITLTAGVLGVVVSFRGTRGRGALPLGLALTVWAYILAYSGLVLLMAPEPTSPWHVFFEGHFLVVEALGLAALLRFTVLFPTTLNARALQDPATLPLGVAAGQRFRAWTLRPAAPWAGTAAALAVIFTVNATLGRPVQDAALLSLTDIFRLGALSLVVLNLRTSFLAGTSEERRRMHWVVAGFALLVGTVGIILGANILVTVTQWDTPAFNWRPLFLDLGVLGLLWGLYRGIFYRGKRDGAALIRGVALASTLLTMALLLAAGLEAFLSGPVSARLALPRGLGTLIATVVFTLIWMRTRRFFDAFLQERWAEVAPSFSEADSEGP